MQTKVQKWGNSLGLRIPKSLAEAAGVRAGTEVELVVESGELVVRPRRGPKYDLVQLLEAVEDANLHGEVDFGGPVGREAW